MTRLTPNAAAERCGQSRATILRAIAAGDLDAVKQSNQWSIDVASLDRWTALRPQRARRRPEDAPEAGTGADHPSEALSGPVSASEAHGDAGVTEDRLAALEALCAALQAEVRELRGEIASLAQKTAPAAPPVSVEAEPLPKRRLWPFSAKS